MLLLLFSNTTVNTQETSKTQPSTSTVIEREPSAVSDVFCKRFDQLVDGVNQQPDIIMMTAKLYSKGLISEYVKDDITTTTGISSSQKSINLVNAIEKQIKVEPTLIIELCDVVSQVYACR